MNTVAAEAPRLPISTRALRAICAGVVRLCFRLGISAPDLLREIKQCFIDIAREELKNQGYPANVSRLSLATGLSRQDIMRTKESDTAAETRSATLVTKILGFWQGHPDYLTKTGEAQALTCDSETSEFYELVRRVSKNIHPSTVLFELQRSGVIEVQKGKAKIQRTVNFFQRDPERGFTLLGRGIDALLSAGHENLQKAENPSPNLHIHTTYDNIRPEALTQVRNWLRKEGETYHRRVREYLSAHDRDVNPLPTDTDLPPAKVEFLSLGLVRELGEVK